MVKKNFEQTGVVKIALVSFFENLTKKSNFTKLFKVTESLIDKKMKNYD